MKTSFSTLVVTRINGQRTCEELFYSHRPVVKSVQKMINDGMFIQGGYPHRLISFMHRKRNFTRFKVLIDNRDLATIDIHTIITEG